ncbi:hypothetical protein [Mechercharimyces sp. CAU 1602]|uniref:hypothetical protein n=1 Tax=Mechercharimyces sp. CAU 1602 TaxID=2973933 RepID=UPI0021616DA2|nr:hypothetical protein [Mechercharimyces sp. CAU 1602]MCS1350562.1 hypothetical protein [Mechercharimyces sp. CAU 1602]
MLRFLQKFARNMNMGDDDKQAGSTPGDDRNLEKLMNEFGEEFLQKEGKDSKGSDASKEQIGKMLEEELKKLT